MSEYQDHIPSNAKSTGIDSHRIQSSTNTPSSIDKSRNFNTNWHCGPEGTNLEATNCMPFSEARTEPIHSWNTDLAVWITKTGIIHSLEEVKNSNIQVRHQINGQFRTKTKLIMIAEGREININVSTHPI